MSPYITPTKDGIVFPSSPLQDKDKIEQVIDAIKHL